MFYFRNHKYVHEGYDFLKFPNKVSIFPKRPSITLITQFHLLFGILKNYGWPIENVNDIDISDIFFFQSAAKINILCKMLTTF